MVSFHLPIQFGKNDKPMALSSEDRALLERLIEMSSQVGGKLDILVRYGEQHARDSTRLVTLTEELVRRRDP